MIVFVCYFHPEISSFFGSSFRFVFLFFKMDSTISRVCEKENNPILERENKKNNKMSEDQI